MNEPGEQDGIAARYRALPQVERLLQAPAGERLIKRFGRASVTAAIRAAIDDARAALRTGAPPFSNDALLDTAADRLRQRAQPGLRRTVNATGIVLHTNLGRAPLAVEAIAAMTDIARSYANLEFDLAAGRRGARTGAVEALLCTLTGAESALAVNNGAAAILLALAALAAGGEVVVSRGELVEIGGGFRIPDVIAQGGARLVEIGTTNRTRLRDYADAIGPNTRAVLKVHQSNFRIIGFTEETKLPELAPLARQHGLPLVADLGSGNLGRPGEETVRAALADADLVTFSGDKLLGGPQAGLLAGRRDLIDRIRRHPLLRAVRLDKVSLAALEATLRLHRDDPARIPVLAMLAQTESALQARAERLLALIGTGAIIRSEGFAGGGALPEERIPSRAVALSHATLSPDDFARALRLGSPAIVGRIIEGRFALDMLALRDDELPEIAAAIAAAA